MEDIDKTITEVAEKLMKRYIDNLMVTEWEVFLKENKGIIIIYYNNRRIKRRMNKILRNRLVSNVFNIPN